MICVYFLNEGLTVIQTNPQLASILSATHLFNGDGVWQEHAAMQPMPMQSLQPMPMQSLEPMPMQSLQPMPMQALQPILTHALQPQ